MGRQFYKVASAVLGALVGSACGDDGGSGGGGSGGTGASGGTGGTGLMAEYGMPTAHYVVSGTVTAEDDSQAIEGISVAIEGGAPATSDANGEFTIDFNGMGPCSSPGCSATVTATDVDGAANGGEFETTIETVTLEQTDPGSGTWDMGTFEAQDVDIAMPDATGSGGGTAGGGTGGAGVGGAGGSGTGGSGGG